MSTSNIFNEIPTNLESEIFEDIVRAKNVRIERILSKGHCSPESGWYDQAENEWVIVLQGSGKLVFDDETDVVLGPGDHINIPAHRKHRVICTGPATVTVWLAVFYK